MDEMREISERLDKGNMILGEINLKFVKLDNISNKLDTLGDKLDTLPERLAEAMKKFG